MLTNHRLPDSLHFLSIKGQPISLVSVNPHHKAMPANPPTHKASNCEPKNTQSENDFKSNTCELT